MIERIDAPVSVISIYDHKTRKYLPYKIKWEGKDYVVSQVGMHHKYKSGNTLHHIFSVSCRTVQFRLNLDTDSLAWRLEEVSDGQPN